MWGRYSLWLGMGSAKSSSVFIQFSGAVQLLSSTTMMHVNCGGVFRVVCGWTVTFTTVYGDVFSVVCGWILTCTTVCGGFFFLSMGVCTRCGWMLTCTTDYGGVFCPDGCV